MYVLRFTVTNKEGVELGMATVHVTVHPAFLRAPPVPVIRPEQHLQVRIAEPMACFWGLLTCVYMCVCVYVCVCVIVDSTHRLSSV